MIPVYAKRRPIVKEIPKFWPVALINHDMFGMHAQHNTDLLALSYLEDLWVERDPEDHRCFTIEFVSLKIFLFGNPHTLMLLFCAVVLQGEPFLLRLSPEEGVQIRAPTFRC